MFNVLISNQARKFIKKLDNKRRERILVVLETLKSNPMPFRIYDLKKLEGIENSYRIRIGNMRITYELLLGEFIIKVRYVGFRGKAY